MDPVNDTNTLPLSIAELDSTIYTGRPAATAALPEGQVQTVSDLTPGQKKALEAVTVRAGQVEAAEWALDQAKAVFHEQTAAALASGVPAELVAAAAGTCASALPAPTDGAAANPPGLVAVG